MDEFVEEHHNQHVWEGENERSWEDLIENEGKLIKRARQHKSPQDSSEESEDEQEATGRRGGGPTEIQTRKWMLRSVILCIDASAASALTDYRPTRLQASIEACKSFTTAFFDQNPLSSLGLLCVRDGEVEKLCDLSARSAKPILTALDSLHFSSGQCTLQNVLNVSKDMFAGQVLEHSSRELVLVCSAVNLCDPGDVYLTMSQLSKNMSVSVVHLSAQVEVYKRVCRDTGGTFSIPRQVQNLRDVLLAHHVQPPRARSERCHIVRMGFPSQTLQDTVLQSAPQPAFVLDRVVDKPLYCPLCQCAAASIPATCRCCQLQLLSSSHLARSFHHLFPLPLFEKVQQASARSKACFACGCREGRSRYACGTCRETFCRMCNALIHDTLFACPGCRKV